MNENDDIHQKKSFVSSIFIAYKGISSSYKRELNLITSERKVLVYCFIVSLILFLSGLPSQFANWLNSNQSEPFMALAGISLFTSLFFVPLALYGVSSLIHILAKIFKGSGTFQKVRIALFWTLIVCSPIIILNGLIQGYFNNLNVGIISKWVTNVFVAWVFSNMLKEAEGFSSVGSVFIVIMTIMIVFQSIIYLFLYF